jgi:hypothetical protein
MIKPGSDSAKSDQKAQLQLAQQRTLMFSTSRASDMILGPAQLQVGVSEEASFSRVSVDANGLTGGMRLHLLQPIRALLGEWRNKRADFDRLIEPVLRDIEAVEALEAEVEKAKVKRTDEIDQIERQLESSKQYVEIRDRNSEAKQRWTIKRAAYGNREANMFAYNPVYLILIMMIGGAEWLINYDTFYLFTGVPAIAAGATLILGFLLAFAAHGWGTLLKQWSFRFGQHRERGDRVSDWRMFGLSVTSLLVVLGAAGGSRYAAVLHMMPQAQPNIILGPGDAMDVSPVRDVLISLMANLGAWLLGVFIAYVSHDPDPEFMDATRQNSAANRAYNRARKSYEDQIRTVEARFARELEQKTTAAQTRAGSVEYERGLLMQVNAHEKAIIKAAQSALVSNMETYRDLLAKTVLAKKGEVVIIRTDEDKTETITPFEYKSMKLSLDEGLALPVAA